MKKKWLIWELKYLKNNWNVLPLSEIILALGRTEDSITRKARRIYIDVRKKEKDKLVKNWKKEEDDYLICNYGIITNKRIAKDINRSPTGVSKRAKFLEIIKVVKRWTAEDEIYLEERWGMVCLKTLAKNLSRSIEAVLLKAWNMGLRQQVSASGTFLTPLEVSVMTGVCLSTLYSYIRKDKIRHKNFKTGNKRKYQITPESLLIFLEKYQEDWNSKYANIRLIKAYYSSYYITEGEIIFKENIPEWLSAKLKRE